MLNKWIITSGSGLFDLHWILLNFEPVIIIGEECLLTSRYVTGYLPVCPLSITAAAIPVHARDIII